MLISTRRADSNPAMLISPLQMIGETTADFYWLIMENDSEHIPPGQDDWLRIDPVLIDGSLQPTDRTTGSLVEPGPGRTLSALPAAGAARLDAFAGAA